MLPKLDYEAEKLRQQIQRLKDTEQVLSRYEGDDDRFIVKLDTRLDPDPYGLHGMSADRRIAAMKVQ